MIIMPRFFVDQQPQDGVLTLTGENAHHAGRVLRLRVGEGVTLCDGAGMDFDCTVEAVEEGSRDLPGRKLPRGGYRAKAVYHAVYGAAQGRQNGIYRAEGGRARRQSYRTVSVQELRFPTG